MSLNWNIEKCRDWKQLTEPDEWRKTDSLIWLTMTVGFGSITEANAGEFYRRVVEVETRQGYPSYFTLADIERRIGLYTNAGSLSRREFTAKMNRLYPKVEA